MSHSSVRRSQKHIADTYARQKPEDLIIRDLLALDRTNLANERTLLSYMRTALGVAAAGAVAIKTSPEQPLIMGFGFLLLALSGVTFIYGWISFFKMRKVLLSLNEPPSA